MSWASIGASIITGGAKLWKWYKGAKTATDGANSIFKRLKGIPNQPGVRSLVGQAPNLNFVAQGGRVNLKEGSGLMAHKGDLRLDRPTAQSGNEWLNLQKNYLAYLNMAEHFEEPGKVRRAVKLTV